MAKSARNIYSSREISAFCLQISLLLHAAIPLDEGLSVMAEDAVWGEERKILLSMAEEAELGIPFSKVLEQAGVYPPYVIRMVRVGEETGNLDKIMESLAEYYDKEDVLYKNIKHALTYPIIMITMLLVVLLVLFTKVMPIFEGVYRQLGAEMPPASLAAARLGGIFIVWLLGKKGKKVPAAEKFIWWIKKNNKIALSTAKRRFTSVLSLTLKSGLDLEKGMELAGQLVDHKIVEEKINQCSFELESGATYYTAMKNTGLFTGFYVQMIKVGTKSGRLDSVMAEISDKYEEEADTAMEQMINRFEPTVVAVLAISVGLILLSVMLPLMGVLSAIG